MAAGSSKIIVGAAPRLLLLFSPFRSHNHLFPSSTFNLRASHWSAYEKNQDEQISTIVPNHVTYPNLSDNYWVPHPETGVFGPPKAHHNTPAVPNDTSAGAIEGSVLNLKAWFRHSDLEDPEKPHTL